MAVIAYDGFDHYGAQADMQSRRGALQWGLMSGGFAFDPGRGGYGYCVAVSGQYPNTSLLGCAFNVNLSAGFASSAILLTPIGTTYFDVLLMDYVLNVAQVTVRFYPASGLITVYSGDPNTASSAVLGSSPPNAFSPFIWNKYEIGAVIGSSGSINVQVNGTGVLSVAGSTTNPGVGSPNDWFNGYTLRFPAPGGNSVLAYVDDFNLNDTTTGPGTYPCNSFMGDVATRTVYTTANSSVQWTPLTGTNYVEVGEISFDGDTSYNYATAVGNTDLFTFGALPTNVSVVFAVQVTGAYRKLDASAQTIVQKIVSSGTSATGSVWNMSLSYSYVTDLFVLDPHTGATWTPTAVNALIGGYTLNS